MCLFSFVLIDYTQKEPMYEILYEIIVKQLLNWEPVFLVE